MVGGWAIGDGKGQGEGDKEGGSGPEEQRQPGKETGVYPMAQLWGHLDWGVEQREDTVYCVYIVEGYSDSKDGGLG